MLNYCIERQLTYRAFEFHSFSSKPFNHESSVCGFRNHQATEYRKQKNKEYICTYIFDTCIFCSVLLETFNTMPEKHFTVAPHKFILTIIFILAIILIS